MKCLYILILFILISCSQKTKEKKVATVKAENAAEFIANSAKKVNAPRFKEVISKTKTRPIPLTVATNFDSFIEEGDYNKVEDEVLKLNKIYPNFYKKEPNYKAIASYKLELSSNFYTVVVTVLKGDNKMESVLINYDLKGNIIDYKVISYAEIVEGFQTIIESKIEKDKLTINSIADMEERSEDVTVFKIDAEGKIKPVSQKESLINNVIQQLNLEKSKIKTDLIVSEKLPNNPNETIVVLPEIVDESEHYFELNSHILIVNNTTGKITHKYFESSKTNGWVSDAIQLREITIDTAPYNLTETNRAFGVRVRYVGSSQVNPYENETISLFVKLENYLKNVLYNFDVINDTGAFNEHCVGEFADVENTLHMATKKTNGYFDILVKSKVTESESFINKNGDCDSKDIITTKTKWLKFNGKKYEENIKYSIMVNEIDAVQFHTIKKEKVSVQKKKVKITDFNEAIKTLRGIVEFDTQEEGYLFIKKINFRNGDIKTNQKGILSECSFAAYFPEVDILLCKGGHETDVSFNLKNGKETEETGNPEQMTVSPKHEFRLNGYFGGQECYSYFIQKQTNNGYEKIIQLDEIFEKPTDIWLCTIGQVFWIDERALYLEETNLDEKSKFFKIEIIENK